MQEHDKKAAPHELATADLGDARRSQRLVWLAETIAAHPGASFPQMVSTPSELEALYRFLRNDHVTLDAVLQPHLAATAARAQGQTILVVHDTSEFKCNYADQKDLGRLRGGQQGFLGHFSLAVLPGAERLPLGLLAVSTWKRDQEPTSIIVGKGGKRRRSGAEYARLAQTESNRWWTHAQASSALLSPDTRAVHVMDREADIYTLLQQLSENGLEFVIRHCRQRRTHSPEQPEILTDLRTAIAGAEVLLLRDAPISMRAAKTAPSAAEAQPERATRKAKLQVSAARVVILRPLQHKEGAAQLTLNIVHVREVECPEGEEPIEWILMTNRACSTGEEVAWIVDAYRSRWLIEDYFKAIKTGCNFTKRQLESYQTLQIALAVSAFVAWQLLLLRGQSRAHPDAPAETVLSPGQLQALRHLTKGRLPALLTVALAFKAIARLGGHLPTKSHPGWLVLTRGMHKVIQYQAGYQSATQTMFNVLGELGLLDQPELKAKLEARLGAMGIEGTVGNVIDG